MMLHAFYMQTVQTTNENFETRLALESQRQESHLENMKHAIQTVFDMTTQCEYRTKITEAASKGYNKCTLYTFSTSESIHGFPISFLMFGPKMDRGNGKGLKYFENANVESFIKKIIAEFQPFWTRVRFIRKTNMINIDLTW